MDFLSFAYLWSLLEEQWLETLLYEEQQNPFPSPVPSAAIYIMEVFSMWLHCCNVTYRYLWYCHHHGCNGHAQEESGVTVTTVLADLTSLCSHNHCNPWTHHRTTWKSLHCIPFDGLCALWVFCISTYPANIQHSSYNWIGTVQIWGP